MKRKYSESDIELAIKEHHRNPDIKISNLAEKFKIPRTTLVGRLRGAKCKKGQPATNTKLKAVEEKSICTYIDHLDSLNLAVRPELITDAANYILKERSSPDLQPDDIPVVGKLWTSRFIRRNKYLKQRQQVIEAKRKAAEDPDVINNYFQLLKKAIIGFGITPEDTWNMDESGFRIGVGKDQLIITKRHHKHYFSSPENRESATVIEAISAGGSFIPAFVILSGKQHMARWYSKGLDGKMKISVTSTGYTNDEITFNWLEHFEEHTKKQQVGAWRLLILDGHGSHHTIEFIQYCRDHGIIPFGMPAHLTHILQPLDVVIFQPLKHYYRKNLDIILRDGIANISKPEFLYLIQKSREQTLQHSSILSAFRNTGIWPFDPLVVLRKVTAKRGLRTPSPLLTNKVTENSGSPEFDTPYTCRQANLLADDVTKELLDSPLAPALTQKLQNLIKGTIFHATTALQLLRSQADKAEATEAFWRRRSGKNRPLQVGGTLQMDNARHMVRNKDEADEQEVIAKAVDTVTKTFKSNVTKPLEWRITQLRKAWWMFEDNKERIVDALKKDLNKHRQEALPIDVVGIQSAILEALKHIKAWNADERPARTNPLNLLGGARIRREPKGVALIISAWNYPFMELFEPMVAAIAAGCTTILKPSELAPASQELITRIVPRYLD
ncbi:hypothetical protein LLEC1_05927, partial [Akanthomyces lecanii]